MNIISILNYSFKIFFLILLTANILRADVIDRVVARVNDAIITLSDVEERARLISLNLSKSDQSLEIPKEKEILQKALDILIEERLIVQEGKKLGMKVEDEKVQLAVDDIKKQNNVNDKILEEMLSRDGMTIEEYKNKIREQITMSQVRKYIMRGKVNISEGMSRSYYNKHQDEFIDIPRIKLKHILFLMPKSLNASQRIIKRKKAKDVVKQIKAGADFESIAKIYSEDDSASSGGDLGILSRGKMLKEFEDAAFSLKEGEVSSIVETSYGLHIIKVEKIFPVKVLSFKKVRKKIESLLYNQEVQKKYLEWIEEMKKTAYLERSLFGKKIFLKAPPQRSSRYSNTETPLNNNNSAFVKDSKDIVNWQDNKVSKSSQQDIDSMEKRLRYIKILKERRIITSQEYERRKIIILKQF